MMWHQQTSRRRDPSVAGFSQDLVLGFAGQPEQIQEAEPLPNSTFGFPRSLRTCGQGFEDRTH
jgi:hypothetical protein